MYPLRAHWADSGEAEKETGHVGQVQRESEEVQLDAEHGQ
jgi:hypothetical protein